MRSSIVAQAYNPRYLRGGDQKDCSSRPAPTKKVQETPSQQMAGHQSSQLHGEAQAGGLQSRLVWL
jgi:hypothetical protein